MSEILLAAMWWSILFGQPASLPTKHPPNLSIQGKATWYDWRPRQAAAGPALRKALGKHWRGKWVTVTTKGHSIRVRLTDWCACGHGRVIDLDDTSFKKLAPLSRGVLSIRVNI